MSVQAVKIIGEKFVATHGTSIDYSVAGFWVTSWLWFNWFVEQSTPIIAWLGLVVGLAVGVQRYMRNRRFRHVPPGSEGK